MPKASIASRLERARTALSAIETDETLRQRLAAVGYDAAAFTAGRALYSAAVNARTATHGAHGDQLGATTTLMEQQHAVEQRVSALTQMVRTVFAGDTATLEALGLRQGSRATPDVVGAGDGDTPSAPTRRPGRSLGALLDRARTLYDGALAAPDVLAPLATVGYPEARLRAERAAVAALEQADTVQEGEKADAKAQTAEQTATLEALEAWVARLRGVSKVALQDAPHLLEKMGF